MLKSLLIQGLAPASLSHPLTCQVRPSEPVGMTAQKMTREGSILRGAGAVEAKVGDIVLHAETGLLNRETGELVLGGHVHFVMPPRTDHNLFRYDSSALVTEQAVDVFADRLTVKNMIIEGSGHIRVRTSEAQLIADEIEIYMSTADARVKGNIQAVGVGVRGVRQRTRIFPPEIIK